MVIRVTSVMMMVIVIGGDNKGDVAYDKDSEISWR